LRSFSRAARRGHFIRLLPEHVAARLHLGKINLRRKRGLLYARDEHDGAARAELRACPGLNFRRLRDAPPVQESAEARIGVHEQAPPVLKPKLRVTARDHRPLRLIKDDVAFGWVASYFNCRVFKGAFGALRLPIALFYQNNFHGDYVSLGEAP
jgi:hypothetical protein